MSTKCQHQCQQNVNKNELTSGEHETPTLNKKEEKNQLQGANINVNEMLTTIENEVTKTKEEKGKEKEPKRKGEKNENKKHTHTKPCACTRVDEGEPAEKPKRSAAGRPSFEEVRNEFDILEAADPEGEARCFLAYNCTKTNWTGWKKRVALWMHRAQKRQYPTNPGRTTSSFDAAEFFDAAVNQTYRQEKGGG